MNLCRKVLKRLLPSAIKQFIWRNAGKHLGLKRTLPSGRNLALQSYSDWCIYNDIFADGEYDVAIAHALRCVAAIPAIQILDLGANAGFFTLRVIDLMTSEFRRRSRFTLVEPSASLVARLDETFGSFDGPPEIEVVRGLVGKRTGSAHFQIKHEEIGNAITETGGSFTRVVDYVDLEGLAGAQGDITLLKCDIEGSEFLFMENYQQLLGRTQTAVFEFHEPGCGIKEGIAQLAKLGLGSALQLRDSGTSQTWYFQRRASHTQADVEA